MEKNNTKKNTRVKDAPMTKKQIIITAVVAVLIVAIIAVATVFIVRAITDTSVDFMKDDLTDYITIKEEDYKNIVVEGPFEKYSDEILKRRINSILSENKDKTAKYNGLGMTSVPITIGDVVEIVYRGYTVDENGKETDFEGGTNLTSRIKLEVGSNLLVTDSGEEQYFISGFTDGFLGVIPENYERFSMIYDGSIGENYVVYLTYSAAKPDGTTETASAKRVDLSLAELEEEYGEGFKDFVLGLEIGETVDQKEIDSIAYYDFKVEYATSCESAPLTVDVTFPVDYSEKSLRGVAAKFDVYIFSAVIYDTPTLTEAFIKDTLEVTDAELAEYEGADVVEKYTNLLVDELKSEIEKTNESIAMEALWEVFLAKTEVHKYPQDTVQEYYDVYYNQIAYQYSQNSSAYDSIDSCAIEMLGISSSTDWREYLKSYAEDLTLQKLIFYYIMREEGFVPSDEEFAVLKEQLINDMHEYYIELHSDELESLEGEEYDEQVALIKEEMLEYYTDEYFNDTVYTNYATEKMVIHLAIMS